MKRDRLASDERRAFDTPCPGPIANDAGDESFNVAGGAVVTIEMLDPEQLGASVVTTVDPESCSAMRLRRPPGRRSGWVP